MKTSERWLPVPGHEGRYEVSDHGQIRGPRGRILKPRINRDGYRRVDLCLGGGAKPTTFRVHRLVLLAFVGEPAAGQVCRHLDGNPANNRLSNLRWGTQSENQLDNVRHGTHHKAAKTHCPKGHTYDEANTYIPPARRTRDCRSCSRHRLALNRQRQRRAAELAVAP